MSLGEGPEEVIGSFGAGVTGSHRMLTFSSILK